MSLFIESAIKRSHLLKEWRTLVYRIAAVVERALPEVEVYVLGSVVRGDCVGGSDVDVLVISEYVPEKLIERAKLKALIEEKLDLPYYHPFEIHLLRPEEAEHYLERSKGFTLRIV